jgi:hypothetical protein
MRTLEQLVGDDLCLARLRRDDPEFLALADDYEATIRALERWRTSEDPRAAQRVEEYRGLAAELAEEILAWVRAEHPVAGRQAR